MYIHIPWCIKKCPYCDFNSHNVTNNNLPQQQYINCLAADLEQAIPLIWGRTINSIFIGGGTPSLFNANSLNQILNIVRKLTNLSPLAEITIEANPGTVDNTHIAGYKDAGINRISIGIQTFNDKYLQTLGRIHNSNSAIKAIEIAQKYFDNINLDIMYGLPNQSLKELVDDINLATKFSTRHISCYNLTIEPNTMFYKHPPNNLPDNDLCYSMQDLLIENLANFGYMRYEVSAYAQKNYQCNHNLNYWLFGDYLGIGAGSHSKLSFHNKIIRQVRHKHPQQYMEKVIKNAHIYEDKSIALADLPFEFLMNSLRLSDGFSSSLFVERTGLSLNMILKQLNQAIEKGLLQQNGQKIIPTKLGQDFLNDLLILFLEKKL